MAKPFSTYLQLPAQLGGLRFGPFNGPIRIGSDPKCNQIVLDAGHGIYPSHATVTDIGGGQYTIVPAQPQCQVFLMQQGQQQVWPVRAPVQAQAGDMVFFGTPNGPRFQLQCEEPGAHKKTADQIAAEARTKGGEAGFIHGASAMLDNVFGPSKQRGVAGELQRQSRARLITKSPFREIYQA